MDSTQREGEVHSPKRHQIHRRGKGGSQTGDMLGENLEEFERRILGKSRVKRGFII